MDGTLTNSQHACYDIIMEAIIQVTHTVIKEESPFASTVV